MCRVKNRILVILFFVLAILTATCSNAADLPFSNHNGYVVVISDLHHPFFSKNIEAIFKEITSIKPAHVFMLGDLTELGKDSEFESLKKSLATLNDSTIKYDVLLGNHDTRWSSKIRKTKELGKALYENYRVDIQDIAFIGIDTSMYFEQLGHIGEEQMNWIKEQMELSKRDGKIAILMSHHPLIPASSNVDDSWKLLNLLDAYNVPVALAGHVHKYSDGKLHNGTFFQTVGGARDGWMTVVSWDAKYIYMWKYNSTDHYSGYSLIAKVAREYNERFDQKISFNSSNQGTITQITIETKNIKELNVYVGQKLARQYTKLNQSGQTNQFTIETTNYQLSPLFIKIVGNGMYGTSEKYLSVENKTTQKVANKTSKEGNIHSIWTYKMANSIFSQPTTYKNDLIIADYSGNIVRLTQEGKELWRQKGENSGPIVSNVAIYADNILVGDIYGNLTMLDISTGKQINSLKLAGPIFSITTGSKTAAIGVGNYLYIVDLKKFSIVNSHDLGGVIQTRAKYLEGNYFQTSWGGLLSIVGEDGKMYAKYNIGQTYYTSGACTPEIFGSLVILTNSASKLQALDINNGNIKWNIDGPKVGYSSITKYGSYGLASTIDGLVYKFELNSGKILWNTKTQSTIYDSSPQIFNNRYAILGTTDGELIIIDAENGKMLQKTFLHPSYILTKLIAQDSKIFVAFTDGTVKLVEINL